MNNTPEIKLMKLDEIIPYDKNPRDNEDAVDKVAESIKSFGFKSPIILDKDHVIICGHTRYEAAKLLDLKQVPCIIATDLTKKQAKAYRLADNKTSEFASWDMNLLNMELEDLSMDFDMELFGFDIDTSLFGEDEPVKENARDNTYKSYNLDLYDEEETEGPWNMPVIRCDDYIPEDMIGFNYMLNSKRKNVGIHCFVDDYQFERVWNRPAEYVEKIREYDCILSPDFSLYMDMPRAMKLWNVYRSRLIGQYWQSQGIRVIPTVSWAEEETFEWCFDGIPEGSIVAVSTIGVKRKDESMQIWKSGMDAMIEKIKPKAILVYGGKLEYDYGDIAVKYYDNHITEKWKADDEIQD